MEFDVTFRGADAVFVDGSRRYIGPGRHTKAMPFCRWPRRRKNRGRHLIFGDAQRDGNRVSPQREDGLLMGIYCNWFTQIHYAYKDIIDHELSAFGGFSRNQEQVPSEDVQTDSKGLYWDLSPPPGEYHEHGTVYGSADLRGPNWRISSETTPILTNNATVAWVDCGRPIKFVKATLCHTEEDRMQLPLAAISFTYADDGTTKSLGPTHFSPTEQKNKFGFPFCSCNQCFHEGVKRRPHYIYSEWDVGGATIQSIRVWRDHRKVLKGLQLLAERNSSPICGDVFAEQLKWVLSCVEVLV